MNINYPHDLPVSGKRNEIRQAIADNQIVIVAGDTGSGKTTQIPKICLELYPDSNSLIGCTQPRRIAASSVSERVTEELAGLGNIVGYKIRFHDHTDKNTRIKFMTDGVLLAESRNDPLLKQYGVIVLDEAHERSLNIDFLLGYLKRILPKRPDLKLIITSATIDTEAFSKHFGNAPVVNVSGRTYPVEVRYQPAGSVDDEAADEGNIDASYVEHCAEAIIQLYKNEPPGDILAFLPTEKDIRACCNLVAKQATGAVILPMFGRLQSSDQRRIFQHHSAPKIVIATNVAETSITVPGIKYVVDSGLARMSYYNARAKTTSLPIHRISRASCDQRKGRCGRVGPGLCIRLYTEEDYLGREEFTLPEIKRANLAEVILQMVSLKLGKPEDFPFIEPPHRNTIRDGYKLLQELGAISNAGALTESGKIMAHLPIDPCISRILLEANSENCLSEVKVIASALAIQDPRMRPAEKEKEADAAHQRFAHKHSDFMTLLNIWNDFHDDQGDTRSWSKLKKYCKANYLSFQRMREWLDLQEQLGRILDRQKEFSDNSIDASYQQIHRALSSGFLRNIAVKKQGKIYQGAGNRELMIFPGSHQFLTAGQWIIAASFLETNRLYGLTVATIEPEWLESLGSHLVKYSWSSPRWNKKSGQVIADERVSLFGLIIVAGRTVNFPKRAAKNIPEARQIFIQAALIEGEIKGNYPFLNHNQQLITKWKEAEDRLRTTAILLDDTALFSFYDERLPDFVCDRATLNKFLKRKGQKLLQMSDEDIVNSRPDDNQLANYPTAINVGSLELQVEYNFSPGRDDDGMTVRIPLSLGANVSPAIFEWLVPGMLKEKVQLLLKGLPKSLRKHLVPVNVAVDRILDDINSSQGSLYHALESSIFKMYRISIKRSDWPTELPGHLRARFTLFDLDGRDICSGRDLGKLLKEVESTSNSTSASEKLVPAQQQLMDTWRDRLTREWDFDGLPESIPLKTPDGVIAGFIFPALVPYIDKGGVGVTFEKDRATAYSKNLEGVEFLFKLQFSDGFKSLKKYCNSMLSGPTGKFLIATGLDKKTAVDQLLRFIFRALFPAINGTIPDKALFEQQVAEQKKLGLYRQGQAIAESAVAVLRLRREVSEKLAHYVRLDSRKLLFTKNAQQKFIDLLNDIVPGDFFLTSSLAGLDLTQRQLQSYAIRVERFYNNPTKDAEKEKQLKPHLESLRQLNKREEELSEEARELLNQYRQMIEEYRITLFSPEIKSRTPVSAKKLKQLQQAVLSKC
ncbi:ATP-dependent RNA helicase HrpA [Desulfosediminicola ganghwensis]|uniref:ATP-dependent RNA helicase HrpA n=1 Tax=Desulfosediminicola ganghwensis TaxID=2569540 RepID=UPI0010ACA33B|nr:ATP-dependent RNA helicase HrpA [Desulfosediminicola ganghwensis]